MQYLLDTHVLIWFDSCPERFSKKVLDILLDEENKLYISHASLWEMQIKCQIGKLTLETGLKELIESQQKANDLQSLHIQTEHIYILDKLPLHHRDPFDRMLIAQAMVENLILLRACVC